MRRRGGVWESFDKYEMTFAALTGKVFEESDECGEKVVAVEGGVVVKVTLPSMKFKQLEFVWRDGSLSE